MPICKREGFDSSKKCETDTFNDNDDVFFCEVTKQIFRYYEDYFRHIMAINSTVWQCEATGRENLTYAEALKSEKKARLKMELFKDSLKPAVMLVIEHAKQSSINTLNAIVAKFLRKRYFLGEEVTACHNSSTYSKYKVMEIIPPDGQPVSNKITYDDTDNLQYKLQRIEGNQEAEIIVSYEKIRRQRQEFTTENMAMFVKDNVTRVDGILRPKPASYKKFVTDRKKTFDKLFIGKMPHYTPSKIKQNTNEVNGKKQSSINKYLVKKSGDEKPVSKQSAQDQAKKLKEKAERAEAKAKSLQEEMERVRREKQEKLIALEREKLARREKLLEKVEKECTELLTKTDDLQRTDQRLLPQYTTISTYIPIQYVGDALMLREFMHSFSGILSGIDVFRNNLSFYELSRALTMREVAGPLSDILLILLGTIFDLQKEEEDDCVVEYLKLRTEQRRYEPQITMSWASRTHFFARRHFSFNINQLPLDAQTLSEVLRLHLLASGACVKERAEKWRIMYRNGYSSVEDPGLLMRMEQPRILRILKMYTVFQLSFTDIIRILRCLMDQILTYSAPINVIEERMEQAAKTRSDLRLLSITENKRLAQVQLQRKALTTEYQQQLLDEEVKANEDKKKQLEEKLNKKNAELLVQSERERKKYEQQVESSNTLLFDFMTYLGMDRAYRKYYALESMPGIFVEHHLDCMDKCLDEPPTNNINPKHAANASNLPKNRKDLRTYLMRMYTEEEKQAAALAKLGKNKKDAQENKENRVVTNGTSSIPLTNGVAETNGNVSEDGDKMDVVVNATPPAAPPTQYQLYMCTGDPKNCIVHDDNNPDRQRWAFLYEKEEIEALIKALNPLGERESQLREQLQVLSALIIKHTRDCPVDQLSITDNKLMNKFKTIMLSETHRKYSKSNFGFPDDADLSEVMYSSLVERVLQFESDIYTGDLGRLKVKNMEKWRQDVQNNTYDSQVKLQWGPLNQKLVTSMTEQEYDDNGGDDEDDYDAKDSGKYANSPYVDPGVALGDISEKDTEARESDDEGISMKDSDLLRQCVRNLASALLQVEQGIERRFLKEPFGVATKDMKDKELLERKLRIGAERLKQWEVSLMESTSYSQVFLHLNVLHDAIMWSRSTNKSSCQVCRRGSDPEKMLLCDECNGGTHMFCMKPKMKTVPEGNWYCNRCVTRLGLKNGTAEGNKKKSERKRKRAFIVEEDENVSEASSVSYASVSKSNGKRASGRQSGKPLQPREIEAMLDDDEPAENGDQEDDEQHMTYNEDEEMLDEEMEAEEAEENLENSSQIVEEAVAESEDSDEIICKVCSYDGGDVTCVTCRESYHLECINLKRPPRYNFNCDKCKAKEEKKRKSKANYDSLDDDDDDDEQDDDDNDDDDDDSESIELLPKRSRHSRISLRNSLPNGNSADDNSTRATNSRRSYRRTGENLPLNSSVLYDLLDDIMKQEQAWPFLRPVSQSEVPDYYTIIKNPMDFAKVKSKLNMGAYQLNEEVLRDIQLIFQNCDTYNVEGNEIYKDGSTLEKFVIERCKELNLPFKPSDMNA